MKELKLAQFRHGQPMAGREGYEYHRRPGSDSEYGCKMENSGRGLLKLHRLQSDSAFQSALSALFYLPGM